MDTSRVFSRSSSASDPNGDGLGGRIGCVSGGLRESTYGAGGRSTGTGQGSGWWGLARGSSRKSDMQTTGRPAPGMGTGLSMSLLGSSDGETQDGTATLTC